MSIVSKDAITKLVFVTILFGGLVYVYWAFFLEPLQKKRTAMVTAIADYEKKLAQSGGTLKQAASIDASSAISLRQMTELEENVPAGAPIAWFPPVLKALFASEKITVGGSSVRRPFKANDLPKYSRTDWAVEIPEADFFDLGRRLAQLENERLLCSVISVRIYANPDHPEVQTATLGLTLVVKD
jgi:hypothetical protein